MPVIRSRFREVIRVRSGEMGVFLDRDGRQPERIVTDNKIMMRGFAVGMAALLMA
jgi:hypothetical protein